MMKKAALLAVCSCLIGCTSLHNPITQDDVVGTWQCHTGGFLSSVQTIQFQKDGSFAFHDTDTIVGMEMSGKWTMENDRIRLLPVTVTVRGKPDTVPSRCSEGILSQPIINQGGQLVIQLEEDNRFKRLR